MKRNLALFDFDGTITHRDSFLDFIKYYKGKANFYQGFLKLLPTLIRYKLKIIPNWQAKETVLSYFFKNEPVEKFQQKCDAYGNTRIPAIVRPKALHKLKEHIAQGDEVYVVSASPENWLSAWCKHMGIKLLATCLETKDGKITGKMAGKNCYGPEKAKRIQAAIALKEYHQIYSYGDSPGDHDMLALAHFPHYRVF